MSAKYDVQAFGALIGGSPCLLSALANGAAFLYGALDRVNWAGFYLRRGEELVLGPFRGKPACDRIPLGKGVCGTAAGEDRVIRVEDVDLFPGHIACDPASRSEIVVPLHDGDGRVWGVLDVDSDRKARFGPEEEAFFRAAAAALEEGWPLTAPDREDVSTALMMPPG